MKQKISVIIPMYNEEKNVSATVGALKKLASDRSEKYDFEFILVNDGSTDGTAEAAEKSVSGDERFVLAGYPVNRGKGCAVRTGMLKSTGDRCVYTDCDLAYGTEAIAGIAERAESEGCDVCIGSRNISPEGYEGYTKVRKFISKAYIKVVSAAAGFHHSDSQCGLKCYSKEAARSVFSACTVDGFAFDLEALMIAEKNGLTVCEYPVKIINHNQNESKVNTLSEPFKMLRDIRKIKKNINKQR